MMDFGQSFDLCYEDKPSLFPLKEDLWSNAAEWLDVTG